MDRDINYLLNKYKTRQPGEIWSKERNQEYEKDKWYKEKLYQLDGLINELHGNFIITPNEKERMKYLLKHLNLHNYRLTLKQQLLMIIIYTKLENNQNRQLSDYQTLLHKYGLTTDSFNRFHFKITQHYIDNYG